MTVPGPNGATILIHPSKRVKHLFVLLQKLLPQHLLSRLVGWVAASEISIVKSLFIQFALKRYGVDLSEAERTDPRDYVSFNDFFTRALKPGARNISGEFCSPADGEISQLGDISNFKLLQAKGVHYSLSQLLGTQNIESYGNGSFITVYLSPKDYHRVHSPVSGTLRCARYIPGKLFSVNQVTTEAINDLFAINERLVMEFDTEHGPVSLIMVGALIVAGIQPIWKDSCYTPKLTHEQDLDLNISAGDELGRFLMGSTAIVVSAKHLKFDHEPGDTLQMGQALLINT